MSDTFIFAAKRTPIGAYLGQFSTTEVTDLGASALKGIEHKEKATEVVMGCVLSGGAGQAPARQATLKAGLAQSVTATTLNKVCGSGMRAVMMAADQVRLDASKVILAGGMECMSQAPYMALHARGGYRFGHGQFVDHLLRDGLEDAYGRENNGERTLMGKYADATALKYGFSREDQDAFAKQTYENFIAAKDAGYFSKEITPFITTDRKGDTITISEDEPYTKVMPEKFAKLKPAFSKDGTVTAANASSNADGAAALLIAGKDFDAKPLAKIVGYTSAAIAPEWFTLAPITATKELCAKINWNLDSVDVFEVNEAFAVVPMAFIKELGVDAKKVNMFGGACCMGHPIGASGARIIVTLLNVMQTHNLKRGIATACIGGGEATAIAIELL